MFGKSARACISDRCKKRTGEKNKPKENRGDSVKNGHTHICVHVILSVLLKEKKIPSRRVYHLARLKNTISRALLLKYDFPRLRAHRLLSAASITLTDLPRVYTYRARFLGRQRGKSHKSDIDLRGERRDSRTPVESSVRQNPQERGGLTRTERTRRRH